MPICPRVQLTSPSFSKQLFCKLGVPAGSDKESQMLNLAYQALANNLQVVVWLDPDETPNPTIYNRILK
jgi:hypothetical protein